MSQLITEALLLQAEVRVARMVREGKDVNESVSAVAARMSLSEEETALLDERAKKIAPPVIEEPVAPALEEPEALAPTIEVLPESIYFEGAEDVEQATSVLMQKGVAWASKGHDDNGHFVQFENTEQLDKAHEVLKRRWDFVDHSPRKVAVMEFDNLMDYQKVLEFVNKHGLMVEYKEEGDMLDEDISILETSVREYNRKSSLGVEVEGECPELPSRAFMAKPKGAREEIVSSDIYENSRWRRARVRRRWR